MIRGDLPTSSRLYDAIHLGVLNIITSDDLPRVGLPFSQRVPSEEFTIKIGELDFLVDPFTEIEKILKLPQLQVERMLRLQNYY